MAVYWAEGKSLTKEEALKEILAISDYEEKTYGSYHDTSAFDTVERIIKGYFRYEFAKAQQNITLQDIINEVTQGKVVIIPANGQVIGNPNYTAPGPERHMVVIRGFDKIKV